MRTKLSTIAAVAAGGYLLAHQMRARRRHVLPGEPNITVQDTGTRMPVAALASLAALAGGLYLTNFRRQGWRASSTVEESIDLEVPVHTAYNQWTQFEAFPRFMASVDKVEQVDDTHLHWRAVVAGKPKEWDSEITEQIPDERIAWRSTGGVRNAGVVTFHRLGDNRTRVMLQMDYQPESLGEKVGDAVGAVKLTTRNNLHRFKQLVESRGTETGAWRGTVTQH